MLEVKVGALQKDVTEIKSDVKALVQAQQAATVLHAAEMSAEMAHRKSRGDLGVWVRASIPWVIALGSLLLGVFNLMRT